MQGERNPWNEATEDTASHHTVTNWGIRYTFSHSNSSATGRIEPLHDIMVHHCWPIRLQTRGPWIFLHRSPIAYH